MPTAAALRLEIEHALERKFPAALTPAPRAMYEVATTGIRAVDELLHGGLPVGAISEVTGEASSGRTSLALQFVAQRTAEERACAWVDVNDAFDPESAAANGVWLKQVLWMRCKARDQGTKGPREQGTRWVNPAWARLEQGLRATDLLLQAGGFAGDCARPGRYGAGASEQDSAGDVVPVQAGGGADAVLPDCCRARGYAKSAAAVVLECSARNAEQAGGTVLRGFEFAVRRERERSAPIEITTRKPPAATWQAHAAWDAERSA